MAVLEPSDIAENCDPRPRAEQCTIHALTDCSICRAERPRRTDESVRAERAFRDWSKAAPGDRPLQKHQAAHARVLFEWMREHGVSKARLADILGINEKQVRKMLKLKATIPAQLSSCIPASLRQDYLDRLAELDGGAPAGLQARIDRLSMEDAADVAARANARVLYLAKSCR